MIEIIIANIIAAFISFTAFTILFQFVMRKKIYRIKLISLIYKLENLSLKFTNKNIKEKNKIFDFLDYIFDNKESVISVILSSKSKIIHSEVEIKDDNSEEISMLNDFSELVEDCVGEDSNLLNEMIDISVKFALTYYRFKNPIKGFYLERKYIKYKKLIQVFTTEEEVKQHTENSKLVEENNRKSAEELITISRKIKLPKLFNKNNNDNAHA